MTLQDIVDVVTTRTGLLEDDDKVACRKFARQRHQMIFNDAIWKDSLREFDYSTSLNGLILTVADNGASGHIDATSLATFQGTNPDATTYFKSLNDAYGIIHLPIGSDRVVAIRTADRYLNVQSRESFYRADIDNFYRFGTPCEFTELQSCVFSTPIAQTSRFSVISDSAADAGSNVTLKYLQSNQSVYTDSFALVNGQSVGIAHDIGNGENFNNSNAGPLTAVLEIFSVIKSATQGNIYIGINGAQNYASILMAKADTSAPIRPRIKLVNPPQKDVTMRFLVKMKCPQFQNDTDETAVRNMENCLIAFVMADAYSYDKQLGKAQQLQQEGVALLNQLKDIEAIQSANNMTISPSVGFGNAIIQPYGRWGSYIGGGGSGGVL